MLSSSTSSWTCTMFSIHWLAMRPDFFRHSITRLPSRAYRVQACIHNTRLNMSGKDGMCNTVPTSCGSPSPSLNFPDQKRCAQLATLRHWSGFFSRRDDDIAQLVYRNRKGITPTSHYGCGIKYGEPSIGYENSTLLHTCSVLWFSSPRQLMRSNVATMRVMAAS